MIFIINETGEAGELLVRHAADDENLVWLSLKFGDLTHTLFKTSSQPVIEAIKKRFPEDHTFIRRGISRHEFLIPHGRTQLLDPNKAGGYDPLELVDVDKSIPAEGDPRSEYRKFPRNMVILISKIEDRAELLMGDGRNIQSSGKANAGPMPKKLSDKIVPTHTFQYITIRWMNWGILKYPALLKTVVAGKETIYKLGTTEAGNEKKYLRNELIPWTGDIDPKTQWSSIPSVPFDKPEKMDKKVPQSQPEQKRSYTNNVIRNRYGQSGLTHTPVIPGVRNTDTERGHKKNHPKSKNFGVKNRKKR